MSGCNLESLENMPKGLEINTLYLAGNSLKSEHLKSLRIYRNHLAILNLRENLIDSYDCLDDFKDFEHLNKINLISNKLSEEGEELRKKIFEKLPQVKIVNDYDKEGNECQSSLAGDMFGEGGEDEFYENMFAGEEGEDQLDLPDEEGEEDFGGDDGEDDDEDEGPRKVQKTD